MLKICNGVCHVNLSSRITSDLHLEIVAKTVIPGYNVVGTSKCILSQAGLTFIILYTLPLKGTMSKEDGMIS